MSDKMTFDEAIDLLIAHNCKGPCPCDRCKEANAVIDDDPYSCTLSPSPDPLPD